MRFEFVISVTGQLSPDIGKLEMKSRYVCVSCVSRLIIGKHKRRGGAWSLGAWICVMMVRQERDDNEICAVMGVDGHLIFIRG